MCKVERQSASKAERRRRGRKDLKSFSVASCRGTVGAGASLGSGGKSRNPSDATATCSGRIAAKRASDLAFKASGHPVTRATSCVFIMLEWQFRYTWPASGGVILLETFNIVSPLSLYLLTQPPGSKATCVSGFKVRCHVRPCLSCTSPAPF